jgi:hypothetical protein
VTAEDGRDQSARPERRGVERTRPKSALDDVFGDVLPDGTRDDRIDEETGWTDGGAGRRTDAESRHEDELRRNVPPHHG